MNGKCLCGKVEFEILGKLPRLYQCHCSLCRKQGGSSSNTATIVTGEQFRWVSGLEYISSWTDTTGFRSDFCSTCGCPVPNPVRSSSAYWVPAGLLEHMDSSGIGVHIFVGSKATWDHLAEGSRQFETMPSLSEFVTLLNEN